MLLQLSCSYIRQQFLQRLALDTADTGKIIHRIEEAIRVAIFDDAFSHGCSNAR